MYLTEQPASIKQPWLSTGLPKQSITQLNATTAKMLYSINEIQTTADRDNRFVYFQQVPSTTTNKDNPLPALPLEASVMNPAVLVLTELSRSGPLVIFHYVPPKSFFSSFFGSSSSSSGSNSSSKQTTTPVVQVSPSSLPSPVPMTVSLPPSAPSSQSQLLTDEQYARQLQRDYDNNAVNNNNNISSNNNNNQQDNNNSSKPVYNSLV